MTVVPALTRSAAAAGPVRLDASQRAVLDHRGGVLRVLGAPGSGKSTVAVEVVASRCAAGELTPDQCLVLTATRAAAARLRDAVTTRIAGTTSLPLARSHQSFAFGVLRRAAVLGGEPSPRLLSGPEQDLVLRELLAGHGVGAGPGPAWPEDLLPALPTRAFRGELRDLLMRAVELGLDPDGLAALGAVHSRPEWEAAAKVFAEYDEVTALAPATSAALDPAAVLGTAANHLLTDRASLDLLRREVRLVVVDDAQELTPAALRLLEVLVGEGAVDLILLGDPDAATQTFRGADPSLFVTAWPAARSHRLDRSHRCPPAVTAAAARVARHIGVVGDVTHRLLAPRTDGTQGVVEARLLRSPAQEASFIAHRLREAHLRDGVPWSAMAVLVRGSSRAGTLRRVLAAEGVPVEAAAAELPVRDEPAVRPFLDLFEAALALGAGADGVAPEVVVDAVTSPLGGADAVTLRRLRRSLRRHELDAGGGRVSDELLGEAVLQPFALDRIGPEADPARRVHRVLAAARTALADPAATAESVLWAMWAATGLSEVWRSAALAGGVLGGRADRDLDAVLALFEAAGRFVDRLPGAAPASFLEHLRGQEVAGDTLVPRAVAPGAVALLTPAAAAGREWPLVVVAGVQEGVWPDLRLRGSLLGSTDLVDVVRGRDGSRRAARAAVRHDETRLFLVAVTRARESLLLTAVRSEDEQPSPYLDVIDPIAEDRALTEVPRPATLRGLVGQLRRDAGGPDPALAGAAVTTLARLAALGVAGADPSRWWSLTEVSDERPRRADGLPVRVSPSTIDRFGQCELQWVLRSAGGDGPSVGAMDVGTLVHEVAHELGDTDASSYAAAVRERWGRLGLAKCWVADRKLAEATLMTERLAAYVAQTSAAGWRRVGTELAMEVALGRVVLSGRVDRLEADSAGALRVIDLKTGTSKPKAAEIEHHGQLGAYQLGIEHGAFGDHGRVSAGAALLQLGKAANQSTTLQAQSPLARNENPAWVGELVEATAERMAGASFTATPATHCRTCPLKDSCPAQPEGRVL